MFFSSNRESLTQLHACMCTVVGAHLRSPSCFLRPIANLHGTSHYLVSSTVAAACQWQHPELSQLYKELEALYNQPCYPNMAYPAALKLRAVQRKTQRESSSHFIH